MTHSKPCSICGRADDLREIEPSGIHLMAVVLWQCPCGNTRSAPKWQVGLVAPDVLARAERKAAAPTPALTAK